MNLRLKYIFYVVIGALILLNVMRIYKLEITDDAPSDYRSLFIGGKFMFDDAVMFDTTACIARWQEIVFKEKLNSSSSPGQIHISALTYPPHAYFVFAFNKFLSWKQGRMVWWATCIISFGFLLFWLNDGMMIALALAFKGSFFALLLGQPMLLVAALIALVISQLKRKSTFQAALLVLLALIKFTLVVPLIIWLAIKRRWNILVVTGIFITATYVVLHIAYPTVINDYVLSANEYYIFIYSDNPINLYPKLNSELTSMINTFIPFPLVVAKSVNILGQLFGFGLLAHLFYRKRIDDSWLLYLLYLVSFIFSYHLIYDALILLIPIGLIHLTNPSRSYVYLLPFILLCVPWNALSSQLPFLQFHFPIILLCALLWALYDRIGSTSVNIRFA